MGKKLSAERETRAKLSSPMKDFKELLTAVEDQHDNYNNTLQRNLAYIPLLPSKVFSTIFILSRNLLNYPKPVGTQ